MRKIIIFVILFGLLFGSLVYSQNFLFREQFEKKEKETPEKNENKRKESREVVPEFEFISPKEERTEEFEKKEIQEKIKNERKEIGEVAPKFEFIFPREGRIKGEVKIKGKVNNANSVEYYYQLFGAPSAVYLGTGQSKGENLWELNWNTNLTPNGKYQLFAKITNQYGEYESERIEITIENEIIKEPEKTEELKGKHQEIRKDIGANEKEINQKTEETLEEISQTVKPDGKGTIRKVVEDFVKEIREEERIGNEIAKRGKEIEEREETVTNLTRGLAKIQGMPAPGKPTPEVPIVAARIIGNAIKESLDIKKTELEEEKKQIEVLQKNLEEKESEKEKAKREIIEKIEPENREEISNKIEQLEKEIKEKEKTRIEKEEVLVKDSDRDDLPDEFEILIGTNPFNPDSDGDGFLDGDEYKLGYNPLKPGAADEIVYSDARKAKPQKTEFYYVERVTIITLPTGQTEIKIEGKGLANSFVTIYIYSPIVMVTKVDGNGNWSIVLDKPLADGIHEVYATVTNNHGEITARSEPFVFEKSGERIVAITISGLLAEKIASPVQTYQLSFLVLVIALVILAIGIALIIVGVSIQRKLKKEKEII